MLRPSAAASLVASNLDKIPRRGNTLILTKVVLSTDSNRSLERVKRVLGDKSYQSVLAKTTKKVNSLAQLSLEAYQSKVPIDGGELRSRITRTTATPQSGLSEVSVSGPHTSVNRSLAARYGEEKQSDILAQVLNLGTDGKKVNFLRTRSSFSSGPYSPVPAKAPTKNWITKARQAFAQARRK